MWPGSSIRIVSICKFYIGIPKSMAKTFRHTILGLPSVMRLLCVLCLTCKPEKKVDTHMIIMIKVLSLLQIKQCILKMWHNTQWFNFNIIVFFTHWSIFAQNCGLIRPSFPVVIIKLGCCTCQDGKRNMTHLTSG